MGELRDRMDRDMLLKNLSDRTRKTYLACIKDFVRFHCRDPKDLGDEEIKAFLHHLIVERKVSQSTVSQMYSALKFFYVVTLEREWNGTGIPRGRRTYKLPVVLSKREVEAILGATGNLNYRTIFATIYSAGLRLREATGLVRTDIDAQRMTIRVRQGTATRCFRGVTWRCCCTTGAGSSRASMCFTVPTGTARSIRPAFKSSFAVRCQSPGSPRKRPSTRCVTVSRRICWKPAATSCTSRS